MGVAIMVTPNIIFYKGWINMQLVMPIIDFEGVDESHEYYVYAKIAEFMGNNKICNVSYNIPTQGRMHADNDTKSYNNVIRGKIIECTYTHISVATPEYTINVPRDSIITIYESPDQTW